LAAHNQGYKLTPQLVDTIAGILKRVAQEANQNGVLWLIEHPSEGIRAVRDELLSRGINPALVISSPFEGNRNLHIQRLRQCADVFLDSAGVYSGGATIADAIAAGLPVVALASRAGLNDDFQILKQWQVPSGSSPVARLAVSLLAGSEQDHPSLGEIASLHHMVSGLKEYEDVVVNLAMCYRISTFIKIAPSSQHGNSSRSQSTSNVVRLLQWGAAFTRSIFAMTEATAAKQPQLMIEPRSKARRRWNIYASA
jgi:hypothetical protein